MRPRKHEPRAADQSGNVHEIGRAEVGQQLSDATLTAGPPSDPTVLQLTSNTALQGYAGLYYIPPSPLTLSAVVALGANYEMTTSTFGGGIPRFSIGDTTNNTNNEIYVYWGTPGPGGTFTDPNAGLGFQNTGNLLADGDLRFQINGVGGSTENSNTYLTFSQLEALPGVASTQSGSFRSSWTAASPARRS